MVSGLVGSEGFRVVRRGMRPGASRLRRKTIVSSQKRGRWDVIGKLDRVRTTNTVRELIVTFVAKFDLVIGTPLNSHELIETGGSILKAFIMDHEQRVLTRLEFRLLFRVRIIGTLTTKRAVKRDVRRGKFDALDVVCFFCSWLWADFFDWLNSRQSLIFPQGVGHWRGYKRIFFRIYSTASKISKRFTASMVHLFLGWP